MTTFAQFKEQYTREMWRTGDADWNLDLPNLMRKAEARIRRDLYHTELISETVGTTTEPDKIVLAGDVREIVSLQIVGLSGLPMAPVQFADLASYNSRVGTNAYSTVYKGMIAARVKAAVMMQTGASVANPVTYKLVYIMGITPYEDDPALPFYDANPDFYEAALNVPAYKYLKDFASSAEYNTGYLDTLESMRAESEYRKYPSGQINVQLPGNVL
jgi:hypothetical protein